MLVAYLLESNTQLFPRSTETVVEKATVIHIKGSRLGFCIWNKCEKLCRNPG